jgi:dihydropyrimidine dehydrogenase (NAD+) subunit PreT
VVEYTPDVRAGRLGAADYAARFADAVPLMSASQAMMEAQRCLYCFDAPCQTACPTNIDVPSFIHRISDGNHRGAASTILESNPLGGMCARVCPTEVLCEQVCVRQTQQGKAIEIGRLQRFAVDSLMASPAPQPFVRAAATGKRIAVVGAGPAGLACAHMLARLGHDVVIFEARPKAGGLNEYGLATYKTTDGFAQKEIAWLLSIGGIRIEHGYQFNASALKTLQSSFEAVFLGIGLSKAAALNLPGEDLAGVRSAVDFIAELRQSDPATVPIGRRVVVIGGGMTAVDASVQAKLLGAEVVHMAYRHGKEHMSASAAEQDWACTNGVVLNHWLAPVEIQGSGPDGRGHVCAVRFAEQVLVEGRLQPTGRELRFEADMVFKAIGQQLDEGVLAVSGFSLRDGRIATTEDGATNLKGVWAGGDCRAGGLDLTVEAVEHGKKAAAAIHAAITSAPTSVKTGK